jgi:integrase/recombinase XerD
MPARVPPKAMAKRLVRVLRPQRPDYHYLKKVFQHARALLEVEPSRRPKRLPELLTETELVALYETIWHARQFAHLVMLKLLLFTGIRSSNSTPWPRASRSGSIRTSSGTSSSPI